ncbi:MAG: ABC transporter ATP-binding protein [Candidatus Marinimicrobia bacterium]|nr:ABC transporter ATP-binding protein [Candidatus Neomarinimicrobiota bacterium]
MSEPIIQVKHLKTYFKTDEGLAKAVDDVSFEVFPGETLGIVGESGCGKSVTALSIMRLIQTPPGQFAGGAIFFKDRDILKLPDEELRTIRGNNISMIFQEPMTSLNPVFTCGNQIMEAIQLHQHLSKAEATEKALEMLDLVGIPDPQLRLREYPHQLSGGMRQRIMIAMALSCNPTVLIADEPTTALDVTIQAQILDLIQKLQKEMNLSVIMITHDLGVIAEIAHRVIVMYAGEIVEQGDAKQIFHQPSHPYTVGLLKSIPNLSKLEAHPDSLYNIKGMVPSATDFPSGCHFHPRCELVTDRCRTDHPDLEVVANSENHYTRCWEVNKLKENS